MQLILTAFVVGLGITSVHPNNQLDAEARTSRVNEDRKLQVNFNKLLDSITTNDTRKSETYRYILETEAKRGREAFDAFKGEMRFGRQRNTHRQRNLRNPNDNEEEGVLVSKRETPAKTRTSVELPSIGYTGTWEQFCDASEMQKDYRDYPIKHELKQVRTELCDLHAADKLDRTQLPLLARYKYCVGMKSRIDDLLVKLESNLTENDPKKKKLLLAEDVQVEDNVCNKNSLLEFGKSCVEEKNPYFRMFEPLIARACQMVWLHSLDITEKMQDVCDDQLVVGDIDWNPIQESIKFKDA